MPPRNGATPVFSKRLAGVRYGLGAVVMLAVLTSACSRLSFVRPSTERDDYEQIAPDVSVRENPEARAAAQAMMRARLAAQYLRQGKLDAAEQQARQALGLDGNSEAAHTVIAAVYDRRGERRRAGEHYRRAAELAPQRGATLNNYGTWLCANGDPAGSLQWFDRALADRSYATPAFALANAGACAHRAGLDQRADAYLRGAIELDPRNPVALGLLAERAFRAGAAFEARAFSERRLSAAPATAEALLLASQIEEKLGDKKAAARYVQRMRAEFPVAGSDQAGDDGRQ